MRPFVLLFACLLSVTASAVRAHDTWFELTQQPGLQQAGPTFVLHLGTGAHYPNLETAIAPEYLAAQGCRPGSASGGERPMRPLGYDATRALRLQAPVDSRSCWVQLVPLDIEVQPNLVDAYLQEIRASEQTLSAWRAQRAQGLPWLERYTKHARIDLPGQPTSPRPVPLGMDLVRQSDGRLQVLRDGQPLPGQAVELLSSGAALGIWRRSDAQGFVAAGSLPPGSWLARAVDLRPHSDQPGHWDSRFVTLVFEVRPPAPQRARLVPTR